jgi:hypothetical protein
MPAMQLYRGAMAGIPLKRICARNAVRSGKGNGESRALTGKRQQRVLQSG